MSCLTVVQEDVHACMQCNAPSLSESMTASTDGMIQCRQAVALSGNNDEPSWTSVRGQGPRIPSTYQDAAVAFHSSQ